MDNVKDGKEIDAWCVKFDKKIVLSSTLTAGKRDTCTRRILIFEELKAAIDLHKEHEEDDNAHVDLHIPRE